MKHVLKAFGFALIFSFLIGLSAFFFNKAYEYSPKHLESFLDVIFISFMVALGILLFWFLFGRQTAKKKKEAPQKYSPQQEEFDKQFLTWHAESNYENSVILTLEFPIEDPHRKKAMFYSVFRHAMYKNRPWFVPAAVLLAFSFTVAMAFSIIKPFEEMVLLQYIIAMYIIFIIMVFIVPLLIALFMRHKVKATHSMQLKYVFFDEHFTYNEISALQNNEAAHTYKSITEVYIADELCILKGEKINLFIPLNALTEADTKNFTDFLKDKFGSKLKIYK